MVLLQNWLEQLQADDPEARQMVSGVSWTGYEALLDELGDSLTYRVTYLDGVLELVSPSRRHERNKTMIGSLIEAYCQEKQIPYFPLGSTTFRKEKKRGGTEPDESYCIGSDKEFPDLAIEVVVTSGGVNKLEVYQRLGVGEVWFFQANRFEVYCLCGDRYEQVSQSQILPNLDLNVLTQFAVAIDPLKAALAFREAVKQMNP
jgi:Uma2 family endonuclease